MGRLRGALLSREVVRWRAAEGEGVVHFDELMTLAQGIFSSDDWVRLVAIAVIIIAAGFFMQGFGQILNVTALALVIFVVVSMVRQLMAPEAPDVEALLQQNWDAFLALEVKVLLVWFLVFGVLISVVYFVRSLVMRG
jgi:hypothetical protein